jgi:hypothetical protein
MRLIPPQKNLTKFIVIKRLCQNSLTVYKKKGTWQKTSTACLIFTHLKTDKNIAKKQKRHSFCYILGYERKL